MGAELGCGDRMCRPCMERFIDSGLKNSLKNPDNIKCPHLCGHTITRQEVLDFGTQAQVEKYDDYVREHTEEKQSDANVDKTPETRPNCDVPIFKPLPNIPAKRFTFNG